MAVDSRLKRQSATCVVAPFMLSGAYPDTAGVVAAERLAVTWMYSGIAVAAAAAAATWTNIILEGVNTVDNQFYQIIGRYKER